MTISEILTYIRCPSSGNRLELYTLEGKNELKAANGTSHTYKFINQLPVLIDFSKFVAPEKAFFDNCAKTYVTRDKYAQFSFFKKLISNPVQITVKNIRNLLSDISSKEGKPVILIVGGGSKGAGLEELFASKKVDILAFDIYASHNVNFIADAHNMPLANSCVDAVIIQAVLEHVIDPPTVVNEIWRVLKPDGLVYAETPFMQQVHEGAYDYTRWTERGHRYLFKQFQEHATGYTSGPGTALLWSVEYFFRSVFRNAAIGKIAKLLFFWLKYFDLLIPSTFGSDAACGIFFYGRKSANTISHGELVAGYKGAQ